MNNQDRLYIDIECYINYFLILIQNKRTRAYSNIMFHNGVNKSITANDCKPINSMLELKDILSSGTVLTFNGNTYDLPLLDLFMSTTKRGIDMNILLKKATDEIITDRMMPWIFRRKMKIDEFKINHIDLINVAFGVASLKAYGARLGCQKLQELPYPPKSVINDHGAIQLFEYCKNDLRVTERLDDHYMARHTQSTAIGEKYGIDLRSKSDAQIAETILKSEYLKITENKLVVPRYKAGDVFQFTPQPFIKFRTQILKDFFVDCQEAEYKLSAKKKLTIPRKVGRKIKIADNTYKLGIGGIHSVDGVGLFIPKHDEEIIEIDVSGMYPTIIREGGFVPPHIGDVFSPIYNGFIDIREESKSNIALAIANGVTPSETDETIVTMVKIITNGLYGKFGSAFSVAFAPSLLMHTTITGQLALLMIIETFSLLDVKVLSANTDGIVVHIKKTERRKLESIVDSWEKTTGYKMDYTNYSVYARRDVNNYFAMKGDGKVKKKGIFKPADISKNPAFGIIYEAVIENIIYDTEVEDTIFYEDDVNKFLMLKKVTGGAHKDGEFLGGTVRFYKSSTSATPINYVKNDNKVGNSDNCNPLMNLGDGLPEDLDLQYYVEAARDLVKLIKGV